MEDLGATSMELNLNDKDLDNLYDDLIDSGLGWKEISNTRLAKEKGNSTNLEYINDMQQFFKMTPGLEIDRTNNLKISAYFQMFNIPIVVGILFAKNFRILSKVFVSHFIFLFSYFSYFFTLILVFYI